MYLRTPRLIFFFLTMALSITTIGLTAWGIKVAYDNKHETKQTLPIATLHVQDLLGSGGAVAAASGIASTICLCLAFLALFRPHTRETLKTVRIKEGLFAFASIFLFASLVPATVIIARRSGVITAPGIPAATIAGLVKASGKNLKYNAQTPAKAYIVVGWLDLLSTLVTTFLVSRAARHVLKHGPDGEQGQLVGRLGAKHDHAHGQRHNEKGLEPIMSTSPGMASAGLPAAGGAHQEVRREGALH